MPTMTLTEQILARASGRDQVVPGDIVFPQPRWTTFHDGYAELLTRQADAIDLHEFARPESVLVSTDHTVSYENALSAERGVQLRRLVRRFGIEHFYDVGRAGHGNVFPIERGLVGPGDFVFAADGNATNFGAVGCLVFCLGSEVIAALALGSTWMRVPTSVRIDLVGSPAAGVSARDVAMWLRHRIGGELGEPSYDAFEIGGPAAAGLSVAALVTVCNSLTNLGPATVIVEPTPERAALQSARAEGQGPYQVVAADRGATYRRSLTFELGEVEPLVHAPGGEGLVSLSAVRGRHIDQAVIGSCASGMYEDMREAARILDGRRIADHVRLIITPATQDVYDRCLDDGLISLFRRAGAMVTEPGCGPCAGGRAGALAAGETSIATINDNQQGRLGSTRSFIHLASPATVAASAVAGHIAHPEEVRSW